ncbi:Glycosyltransferase [Labilithrix luteola]|uniref:Glycosyltransferase n=1 Tax=Labilithrix luteola TaxID=1391654 RepID=A0A0K1PJK5_9BACT|nr:DUF2064 domain-containing protein [Labilithrix luteola]AKU93713.1 Glycosyltransferase [Labilithrix luteola]
MRIAIGVFAEPPLPGRCKAALLAAYGETWIAGLHAAMLRDTLDGLQFVNADEWVVFALPGEHDASEGEAVLARHAPVPWDVVALRERERSAQMREAFDVLHARGGGADYSVVVSSGAPSSPTEPLASLLADDDVAGKIVIGPTDEGGCYLLGAAKSSARLFEDIPWETPAVLEIMRLRCRELTLPVVELDPWYEVDAPSHVMRLLEEMAKHPERAPRTAQFLVTNK